MSHRDARAIESGAILIVVMVVMMVAAIALTAAVQAWSTTWRRDREEELIFRANQYVDAIIAYRKEHGGQFPLNLEDLHKPGPRRYRYIRRLYKDPIAKDGKWGLLYLMPGGQGVYDPKAAQKAQEKASKEWGSGWETAGTGSLAQSPGQMPGVTPIGQNPLAAGVPGVGGMPAGSLPAGAMPGGMPMIPPPIPGTFDKNQPGQEELVSEPPIGWPVIGVISRASGKLAEDTFRIYKGHEHVDEWQFHVFDRGETLQPPGTPMQGGPPMGVGVGYGGHSLIQGVAGGGGGPRPGMWGAGGGRFGPGGQKTWPPQGQGGFGGQSGQYPPGWNPGQYPGSPNPGWNPGQYPNQPNQGNGNQNNP